MGPQVLKHEVSRHNVPIAERQALTKSDYQHPLVFTAHILTASEIFNHSLLELGLPYKLIFSFLNTAINVV